MLWRSEGGRPGESPLIQNTKCDGTIQAKEMMASALRRKTHCIIQLKKNKRRVEPILSLIRNRNFALGRSVKKRTMIPEKVWRVPDGRGLFWDARNTSRQENPSKLLRIEMEIIHILMTMEMY